MSDSLAGRTGVSPRGQQQASSANLADILERVLDKGVVIAGDIQINLLDIELLTIKLRLLLVSVDKAKEMGIDWWEHDPSLSSRARDEAPQRTPRRAVEPPQHDELAEENARLRAEIAEMRQGTELTEGEREKSPAELEQPEARRPRREAQAEKSPREEQTERSRREGQAERPRRPKGTGTTKKTGGASGDRDA